ncbi:MAG: hypothetical protein NC226_04675 [Bacteroides cellulosilyticus]|nr:hypothetical protein [Bacteroides cellulosilyticus]
MKRIFLTCMAVVLCIAVHAQKFTVHTSVGTGVALSTPSVTPVLWRVVGQYQIVERFSVGAGTGLSFYEKTLIPVFADVRFLMAKPRKFTPFLECRIGYGFAPSTNSNGGFYLNPVIGVRYAVGRKHGIFFAVGYESQNLGRLKTYGNHFLEAEFSEKLRHRNIGIEVGFEF